MNHDDGNSLSDPVEKSDIILLGVSRTSKTQPQSIWQIEDLKLQIWQQ